MDLTRFMRGNIKCQLGTLSNLYLHIRRLFCLLPCLAAEIRHYFAPQPFLSKSPVELTDQTYATRLGLHCEETTVEENIVIYSLGSDRFESVYPRQLTKCQFGTLSNLNLGYSMERRWRPVALDVVAGREKRLWGLKK